MSGVPGEPGLVLDELARERLAEGRQLLAAIMSEHDRLQQAAIEERRREDTGRPALRAFEEWNPADRFSSFSVEQLRCLLFAVAERLTNEQRFFSVTEGCLYDLSELDLDLAAGDVRLLAAVSEPGEGSQSCKSFGLVVDLVRSCFATALWEPQRLRTLSPIMFSAGP
jgi:hypothetical protein